MILMRLVVVDVVFVIQRTVGSFICFFFSN